MKEEFENIDPKYIKNNLPVLYSNKVIYIFSGLFSCIFGSILLASNMSRLKKSKEKKIVLAFGFIYTALVFVVLSFIFDKMNVTHNTQITVLASVLGAYIQEKLFFNKYMPGIYTDRNFVLPIIVGLLIFAFFIFVYFIPGLNSV